MADTSGTDPTDTTHECDEVGRGLGRRQALGLFGAATAAAWTAPQIISAPAASAATVAPGGPAAFVAVGAGATVIVAPAPLPPAPGAPVVGNAVPEDGWISVGPIGFTNLNGIATNGFGGDATWVAVGDSGVAYVSNDATATTWTPYVTTTESTLHAITWTGAWFLAVGAGGIVILSPDGVVWTTVRAGNPQAPALRGVACDGTTVVAVGDDGAAVSAAVADLTTWTSETTGATGTLTAVTAGAGGTFTAVGLLAPSPTDFAIFVRATDATWSAGTTDAAGSASDLYAVAAAGSGVIMGAGGSTDEVDVRNQDPPGYAETWTVGGPRAEIEPIRGITAFTNGFVLVGLNGQIAVSDPDFVVVGVASPATADLHAVAHA
jgi:hypothetical protein